MLFAADARDEHKTKRENVNRSIVPFVLHDLRSHVEWSPNNGHRDVLLLSSGLSEIRELALEILGEKNVVGLEITVNDALAVFAICGEQSEQEMV